jgi:hypothetical protein
MWPRNSEQERGRLTGFVCFMHKPDAQHALEACDNTDPFNCGRQLALRWGKSVKKLVNHGDGIKNDPDRKQAGPVPRHPKPIRVMPARDMRKNGAQGGATLTEDEIGEFHHLTRRELCAAREPICKAMAFCFEKSGAAKQIAGMLQDLVMDNAPDIRLETRMARLYLISDVLYNSQQPGVRNAFLYRDAIERMAPNVFTSLGKHGDGKVGRITMNKLSMAVSTVLDAWGNWSVYNPTFLEEMQARFEGREIKNESTASIEKLQHEEESTTTAEAAQQEDRNDEPGTDAVDSISNIPKGDWTTLTDGNEIDLGDADDVDGECIDENDVDGACIDENDVNGECIDENELDGDVESLKVQTNSNPLVENATFHDDNSVRDDTDGQPLDKDVDVDGIPLDEDGADGVPLDEDEEIGGEPFKTDDADGEPNSVLNDADGQPLDNTDGIPLDEDDADRIPLDEDEEIDGEPFNTDDADGEPNSVLDDANGQQLDKDVDVDGIPLDEDDADGVPLDGDEEIDGEPFNTDDADGDPLEENV